MLDTCYLGGRDRHDGRGKVGVTPAGYITAGCGYRNVAMSCDQARYEFNFCVENGGALGIGEAAHLIVGESDVVFEILRQTGRSAFTVDRSDDDIALPMVEAGRIVACRLLATALHILQYLRYCGINFGVFAPGAPRCLLEVSHLLWVNYCEVDDLLVQSSSR
jgi:hypothetical protein